MINDYNIKKRIARIVGSIKAACPPRKIILFGSYARREAAEDSDLDLLIVTETKMSSEEIYRMRRELLRDFSIPVQVICVREEEFLETKDVIGGIACRASKYGEALYEKLWAGNLGFSAIEGKEIWARLATR